METFEFLWKLEDARIVEAIRDAESRTSGEIRVHVSDSEVDDELAAARGQFARMRMDQTRDRNAVLIYVSPRSQKLAVVGDDAAHAECGDAFWREITALMVKRLLDDSPTEAIVAAIERIGARLCKPFPRRHDDRNELPDSLERGT